MKTKLVLLAVGLVLAVSSTANAEYGKKVRRLIGKIVSHPIPLFPGSRVKFNVAPKVVAGEKQIVFGLAPRVHTKNSKAFGLFSLTTGHNSTPIGLVTALAQGENSSAFAGVTAVSAHKNAVAGYVAAGERNGFSFGVSFGNNGIAAGTWGHSENKRGIGVFGTSTRGQGDGLIVGSGGDRGRSVILGVGGDTGKGLLFGLGGNHGRAGLFALGQESAKAWLLAIKKEYRDKASLGTSLVKGVVELVRLIP